MEYVFNEHTAITAAVPVVDRLDTIDRYVSSLQPTTIVVGVHPKHQSKNKFVQWILIKLFGYELEYKTVMAKTIVIQPDDCPVSTD